MESSAGPSVRERSASAPRRPPRIADAALGVLVLAIGAISGPTLSFAGPEQVIYGLIVLGCAGATTLRGRRPVLASAIIGVLLFAHVLVIDELTVFAGAVCLIVAYTAQTRIVRPWRGAFTVAVYLGAGGAALGAPMPVADADWRARGALVAAVVAVVTVAVLVGVVRRHRQRRYEDALERAAALEARQEIERRLAAADERTRIAREMHDVLGHSLNAVAMQAEGVRYVVRYDPRRADQALATIGQLSRSAVDDVRDLMSVLTAESDDAPQHPAPSLRDVPALIGDLRNARAPIRLRVTGELIDVPTPIGLAGYRIIQESLTNVLKHAEGAAVMVRIAVEHEQVAVDVVNARPPAPGARPGAGSGHGIVGMRERARAVGGMLAAGPDPETGGWRVTATLPRSHA